MPPNTQAYHGYLQMLEKRLADAQKSRLKWDDWSKTKINRCDKHRKVVLLSALAHCAADTCPDCIKLRKDRSDLLNVLAKKFFMALDRNACKRCEENLETSEHRCPLRL